MANELLTGPTTCIRAACENTFVTSDGTELFYRAWSPARPSHQAVVLFHRGHEHSGRWQDFVDRVQLDDFWFFAWDARGHGRSPGPRGFAESFARLVRDADEFVRHISQQHDVSIDDMAVVSQSVGSVLAAAWVHDYAPPIRALVLAAPAFRVKLYVPGAIPALRLLNKFKPVSFIKSYVRPQMLTHDAAQSRLYARDELISPQIATNILLDLHDTSTRLIADAAAITAPTLLLISGKDWVVGRPPQEAFFERLSSNVKEKQVYSEFYHSTFWEQDRNKPIARTRGFILRLFDLPPVAASLLHADRTGHSKEVVDSLARPLPLSSPKRLGYVLQRLGMRTLGRISRGIQLGWQTGFDSGQSLDHVYRNKAEGVTAFGRLLDRIYLNSPGWRGIRQRKAHLLAMLDWAIRMISQRGQPVRVLDIAAGPGRYLLEAIREHPEIAISAVLCDRDERGLAAGRSLAKSADITSVVYKQSDAFDPKAIASHSPRPNVAVVSGLWELFPQNDLIVRSLQAAALPEGGLLIYTNQPWHPQQEMIARVLPNRDGRPWVMRCRSQAEVDQLVASAGFRKLDMLIDNEGIFSVALAVRESPSADSL